MKRVMIVAATFLLMSALVAFPGQANARGIFVFMGNQDEDNILQLEVVISESKYRDHKLVMRWYNTAHGRGVNLKLVEAGNPQAYPCGNSTILRGSGNARRVVFGDQEDITEADIQLSDVKGFDKTSKLEFYWLDLCNRSAWIMALPR